MNESSIKNSFFGYDIDSQKNKNLQNAVNDFIINTYQPLSLIDNHDFNKMLKSFDPKFKKTSRKNFTNKIFFNILLFIIKI